MNFASGGTRGVADVGGKPAYIPLCKRTASPRLPYQYRIYGNELKRKHLVLGVKNMRLGEHFLPFSLELHGGPTCFLMFFHPLSANYQVQHKKL